MKWGAGLTFAHPVSHRPVFIPSAGTQSLPGPLLSAVGLCYGTLSSSPLDRGHPATLPPCLFFRSRHKQPSCCRAGDGLLLLDGVQTLAHMTLFAPDALPSSLACSWVPSPPPRPVWTASPDTWYQGPSALLLHHPGAQRQPGLLAGALWSGGACTRDSGSGWSALVMPALRQSHP